MSRRGSVSKYLRRGEGGTERTFCELLGRENVNPPPSWSWQNSRYSRQFRILHKSGTYSRHLAGFSAVQLLPVVSAGLGCSFGHGEGFGGFYCLFPVVPSSPCPSLLSVSSSAVSPAVCLPLCYGLQCRACGCLSLCRSGAASPSLAPAGRVSSAAPLALAFFSLSLLLSLFSLLRVNAGRACCPLSLPCVCCLLPVSVLLSLCPCLSLPPCACSLCLFLARLSGRLS